MSHESWFINAVLRAVLQFRGPRKDLKALCSVLVLLAVVVLVAVVVADMCHCHATTFPRGYQSQRVVRGDVLQLELKRLCHLARTQLRLAEFA